LQFVSVLTLTQCPSKSSSVAGTPTPYYSPSLGNNNNNSGNSNTGVRPKYDFRILKLNYIKDVTPLVSINDSQSKPAADSSTTTTTSVKSNNGGAVSSPKPESAAAREEEKSNKTSGSAYASVLPAVGYVQIDRIQQREQQAVREAHATAARIGVGVSTIAQEIFDALSKT
jgi:hypothetical protein